VTPVGLHDVMAELEFFHSVDTDGDGSVDTTELGAALTATDDPQVQLWLAGVAAAVAARDVADAEQAAALRVAAAAFRVLDADGGGSISATEVSAWLRSVTPAEDHDIMAEVGLFRSFDASHNGLVDEAEFAAACAATSDPHMLFLLARVGAQLAAHDAAAAKAKAAELKLAAEAAVRLGAAPPPQARSKPRRELRMAGSECRVMGGSIAHILRGSSASSAGGASAPPSEEAVMALSSSIRTAIALVEATAASAGVPVQELPSLARKGRAARTAGQAPAARRAPTTAALDLAVAGAANARFKAAAAGAAPPGGGANARLKAAARAALAASRLQGGSRLEGGPATASVLDMMAAQRSSQRHLPLGASAPSQGLPSGTPPATAHTQPASERYSIEDTGSHLVATVLLPEIADIREIQFGVSERRLRVARSGQGKAALVVVQFPRRVDPRQAVAKFSKQDRTLVVKVVAPKGMRAVGKGQDVNGARNVLASAALGAKAKKGAVELRAPAVQAVANILVAKKSTHI
jgi:hypothetical protein